MMVFVVSSLVLDPHLASSWEGEGQIGINGEFADKALIGPSPSRGEARWGCLSASSLAALKRLPHRSAAPPTSPPKGEVL